MKGKQLIFTAEELQQIRNALWSASRTYSQYTPAYNAFCIALEQATELKDSAPATFDDEA